MTSTLTKLTRIHRHTVLTISLVIAATVFVFYFSVLERQSLAALFSVLYTVDQETQMAQVSKVSFPTLQQPEGLDDPTLAYGLAGIADWNPFMIYLDIARQMRQWEAVDSRVGGARTHTFAELQQQGYLDANGWVKKMPAGTRCVGTIWHWGKGNNYEGKATSQRVGRYILTYKGEGEIIMGGDAKIVSNEPGKIVFDNERAAFVSMRICDVDPNNTGNYIRDLSIVKEEHLDLYNAGGVFHPDYLKLHSTSRQIRFMDIMKTNNSNVEKWSEYPTAEYAFWNPMPVELMVRLANEVGADPWFTIPHKADDDFVRQFATYVRDNLDPNLKAYVEYSNEVWNWGFQQSHWTLERGKQEWNNGQIGAWYVKRASEVMWIWDEVYGASGSDRIVKVLAGQAGNTWFTSTVLLPGTIWKTNEPSRWVAVSETFDALALTTYFGGKFYSDPERVAEFITSDEDAAFAMLYNLLRNETFAETGTLGVTSVPSTVDVLARQKALANAVGLDLILYEGGQHIHAHVGGATNEEVLNERMTRFVRSQYMVDLYEQLWEGWKTAGDGPFMHFVDVAAPSKFGSWGLRATLADDNLRAQRVDQLNATTRSWWGEARQPHTFKQGRIMKQGVSGTIAGTIKSDYLIGNNGDNTFYPGPGNDGVNGVGGSSNTVLFSGKRNQYSIEPEGPGYRVNGPDGSDYLYAIQTLVFKDGQSVQLENTTPVVSAPTPTATSTQSQNSTSTSAAPTTTPTSPAPTAPPSPTISFTVSPKNIQAGQSATLTWNSTNATSCTAKGAWRGDRAVAGTESTGVQTVGTKTFTLTCAGVGGTESKEVKLTVQVVPKTVREFKSKRDITNKVRQNSTQSIQVLDDITEVTSFENKRPEELKLDTEYVYPFGLFAFTAKVKPNATETIRVVFDDLYDTRTWFYRKFNTNTNTYIDISDLVTYGTTTINNTVVTTVVYDVADNGPLDMDNRLGWIMDPAGPGTLMPQNEVGGEEETTTTSDESENRVKRSGGGGSSSRTTSQTNQTSPASVALPAPASSSVDARQFAGRRINGNVSVLQPQFNDSNDVRLLQEFLRDIEGEQLTVTGVYGAADVAAVRRFQEKYRRHVLDIWNLTEATGFVGLTTRLKMNSLMNSKTTACPAFVEYNGGLNGSNFSTEIGRTQDLLRDLGFYTGATNNTWDTATHRALVSFQETFRETMLDPWKISKGTGYKYKTTNLFLNYLVGCDGGTVELEGVGQFTY